MPTKLPLVILALIAMALLLAVIWPFWVPLFLAAVLAAALYPLHRWLCGHMGNRRYFAAGIITIASLLLLVLPLTFVAVVATTEVTDGVAYVRKTFEKEGLDGVVNHLPPIARKLVMKSGKAADGLKRRLADLSANQGGAAAMAVGQALAATSRLILNTVLMLIALFFLLADGEQLVGRLVRASPLPAEQTWELLGQFRRTSKAVLVSSLASGAAQALAAFLGYAIAGVPKALFFTIVTFIFALIPAIGATVVVLVVALFLYLTGAPWMALLLVIWGLAVVGLVDQVVKPLVIRGGAQLHGAVVFFSLLGGLAAFGLVGLIAGPLIVTFFLTTTRFLEDRRLSDQEASV